MSTPKQIQGKLTGLHILVVDDDEAIKQSMQFLLQHAGARVSTATNGNLAWQILEGIRPDLMVTDYQMPEADGEALITKCADACLTFPIIIQSSNWNEQVVARLRELSPELTVMTKPVAFADFIAKVIELTGRQ